MHKQTTSLHASTALRLFVAYSTLNTLMSTLQQASLLFCVSNKKNLRVFLPYIMSVWGHNHGILLPHTLLVLGTIMEYSCLIHSCLREQSWNTPASYIAVWGNLIHSCLGEQSWNTPASYIAVWGNNHGILLPYTLLFEGTIMEYSCLIHCCLREQNSELRHSFIWPIIFTITFRLSKKYLINQVWRLPLRQKVCR